MRLGEARPQMPHPWGFPFEGAGGARPGERSEEVSKTTSGSGRPGASGVMAEALGRRNLHAALKRVRQNQGSPGIDGMTVGELPDWLRENWPRVRDQLLAGTYQPQPVLRQVIPKGGGGVRELGIPTVLDRFLQQALLQVLQPRLAQQALRRSGSPPARRVTSTLRTAGCGPACPGVWEGTAGELPGRPYPDWLWGAASAVRGSGSSGAALLVSSASDFQSASLR